jgi:hypothetical protein
MLDEHENIINERLRDGTITHKQFEQAVISRQIETCGFFIYQGDLVKSIHVLSKSLGSMQGWTNWQVWMRAAEILCLAWRKLTARQLRTT